MGITSQFPLEKLPDQTGRGEAFAWISTGSPSSETFQLMEAVVEVTVFQWGERAHTGPDASLLHARTA
jgi:hypothetical protein